MPNRWTRIRFSSRTLLIAFFALAIALAYLVTLLRPFHEYNRRFHTVCFTQGVAFSFTELKCPLLLRAVLPEGYYKRITELYFLSPNHDDRTLEALGPHMKNLTELRRVDFDNCSVSDDGLASISQLPNIKTLRLNGQNFTDAGLEHIRKLTGLKVLVLNGTDISHAGINQLRQALPKCQIINKSVADPSLNTIDISARNNG